MRRARADADVLRERLRLLLQRQQETMRPAPPELMAELGARLRTTLVRVDMAVQALTE